MARPKSTGETKSHQQHVLMTPSEVEAIDTWRYANRIGSRGEAIRRLCQMGIAVSENHAAASEASSEAVKLAVRLANWLKDSADGKESEDDPIDLAFEMMAVVVRGSSALGGGSAAHFMWSDPRELDYVLRIADEVKKSRAAHEAAKADK